MNREQQYAFDLFLKKQNILITGQAGTGKSHLLREIIKYLKNKYDNNKDENDLNGTTYSPYAITSMTGISSLNIDGQTLHSWAGIGLGDGNVDSLCYSIRKKRKDINWKKCRVLIIDEVSMMDAELFEKLELCARKLRNYLFFGGNKDFFGGIQLVLCGDFLQLPPVVKENKKMKFCFESEVWKNNIKHIIYLRQIFRQTNSRFQELLSRARLGILTRQDKKLLMDRITDKKTITQMKIKPTKLFPFNKDVDEINTKELDKLIAQGKEFHQFLPFYSLMKNSNNKNQTTPARIQADYEIYAMASGVKVLERISRHNFNRAIILSVGSQVLLNRNIDLKKGLANGSRGIIVGFNTGMNPPHVIVEFDEPVGTHTIELCDYTVEYSYDKDYEVIIRQIPLQLAWASTIHKSQSQTLSKVVADLGYVFSPGQSYVCLSRVRDLSGLYLLRIDMNKIKAHPKALEFYNSLGFECQLQYGVECQKDPWVNISQFGEYPYHPHSCLSCYMGHLQECFGIPNFIIYKIIGYFGEKVREQIEL